MLHNMVQYTGFFFREVVRLCPKNDKGLHNLDSRIWHLKCTNSGLMKPCEKKDINDQQSKQRWDWPTTNWKDTLTAKISTVNMITAYLDTAFNDRVWTTVYCIKNKAHKLQLNNQYNIKLHLKNSLTAWCLFSGSFFLVFRTCDT